MSDQTKYFGDLRVTVVQTVVQDFVGITDEENGRFVVIGLDHFEQISRFVAEAVGQINVQEADGDSALAPTKMPSMQSVEIRRALREWAGE